MEFLNENALEREATINVDRGLYLLRYVSGAGVGVSPVAMARPALASAPFIEVISAPGLVSGFMSSPGECLVVRAEQPGHVLIKIMRHSVGASMEAVFRLEPVSGGVQADVGVAPNAGQFAAPSVVAPSVAPPAIAPGRLTLLAHVSRRGDVEVGAGDWVAGPQAPAAIEGLEIRGLAEAGLRIDLQPLVATNPPRWLEWVPCGGFAGSRGRFLSLAGLRLRLSGDGASRFVLAAEALFLGSPIQGRRGREIEFVADSGSDPLVGLRLEILPAVEDRAPANAMIAQQRSGAKLRVFRAASGN
jgi:hypothetical protein